MSSAPKAPSYQSMQDDRISVAPASASKMHRPLVRLNGVGSWISFGGLYTSCRYHTTRVVSTRTRVRDFEC